MKNLTMLLFIIFAIQINIAQVPQTTSFQGILTDSEGSLVSDGNYNLHFKLFDTATNGSMLWEEARVVLATGGVFNTILGKVNLLDLPFDKPYWLEISIDGGEALSPRIELTSSFYSLIAKSVQDSSISTQKIRDDAVTTEKLLDGAITQGKLHSSVTIPPGGSAGGDLSGNYPNPTIANNTINSVKVVDNSITQNDILPNVVSSIDGVNNDGGNVDLVAGSNITIVPNNSAKTITISAETGAGDNLGNHTATENIKLSGNFLSGDGGNEGVFVSNNGNVGIGVNNPIATLSIGSESKVQIFGSDGDIYLSDDQASLRFANSIDANSPMIQMFRSGTNNSTRMFVAHSPSFPSWGIQYNDTSDAFIFIGDNLPTLFVQLSGSQRVGIGTKTPLGKLDVNGSIYQRGGILHADYVFDNDYELESIGEHSNFMWKEKHLPAIPKAQVDKDGKEIVEVGSHRRGIVEELEKAHIYIDQLEKRLTKLERILKN